MTNARTIIATSDAPKAIGTYSQAVRTGATVYLSGQIPLDPSTMQLVGDDIDAQIHQVFRNLLGVARAAGGGFEDIVKLTVYLSSLVDFPRLNDVMAQYFTEPFPARAAVGVAELPRGAKIEIDAIMVLPPDR
jgi:reactive intermediate/imine deaminase